MRMLAIATIALSAVGAAFFIPGVRAQQEAEFELSAPPAHAASQHLFFTLAVSDANISGARIYLVPDRKPHSARRAWRYIGMISFFPKGTSQHALFELPLPVALHGKQKMLAVPIVNGKTAPHALQIVTASVGNADE